MCEIIESKISYLLISLNALGRGVSFNRNSWLSRPSLPFHFSLDLNPILVKDNRTYICRVTKPEHYMRYIAHDWRLFELSHLLLIPLIYYNLTLCNVKLVNISRSRVYLSKKLIFRLMLQFPQTNIFKNLSKPTIDILNYC